MARHRILKRKNGVFIVQRYVFLLGWRSYSSPVDQFAGEVEVRFSTIEEAKDYIDYKMGLTSNVIEVIEYP